MLDVSASEVAKKLRQLTLVSRLERTAIEHDEKQTMAEIYMDISAWLEEHKVQYCFDRTNHRYVELEQE